MDASKNEKINPPKLPDVIKRQKQDSIGEITDSPDLDFVYGDTDTHANEIAELYSYTEEPELQLNFKAFQDQMEQCELLPSWQILQSKNKKSFIMTLLNQLEVSDKVVRMKAARTILYIAQGCWAEVVSDTEQQQWSRINVMLLYELGVFSAFTDLLNLEIGNYNAAQEARRKQVLSLTDSQDLRIILSVLYIITEVMRAEKMSGNTEYRILVDTFCYELGVPVNEELYAVKLFGMVTRFCSATSPHFPIKKILLLLWKLLLVSLGGTTELRELKTQYRKDAQLPDNDEDTVDIIKTMKSYLPPASSSDGIQNQEKDIKSHKRDLIEPNFLINNESVGMKLEGSMGLDDSDELVELSEYEERRDFDLVSDTSQTYHYDRSTISTTVLSELPWKPKVRQKDVNQFVENARIKFVGYNLQGDCESLDGLPQPIHEGIRIMKHHMYISLADKQIQKEEEINRNPIMYRNEKYSLTPTEILYQAMLPNLPQYMIALMKISLAAVPTSKAKANPINIMADVLPEEMPMTVLQSMKLGIDVNRHKEIIIKAVSAILLLLLKHFKLNHVCQFEFMSQHLVAANCALLVLKFFNQNIMAYIEAQNVIPILDFPACVINNQPELTAESLEFCAPYSWKNMFTCINLLRILNKLTKWKHSRIMMLVVLKSASILKRTLIIRHAMTQLYVLKLIKMQTKYLGRQWRRSNMKTMSAIYTKVRHRLNDDWAFGNCTDAKPWNFNSDECALMDCVNRFNKRRYTNIGKNLDYEPLDNDVNSALGTNFELPEDLKNNYDLWLQQEVFDANINWDFVTQNWEY